MAGSKKTLKSKKGVSLEKITDQQALFIANYLIDFNATKAARLAGYKTPNVASAKLMNQPNVLAAIEEGRKRILSVPELTRENILRELACCTFRDPLDLCNDQGQIIVSDLRKIPKAMRSCIERLEVENHCDQNGELTGQTIRIWLSNKLGAVDLAMKHKGLMASEKKQVEVVAKLDLAQLVGKPTNATDSIEGKILELGSE